MSFSRPIQWYHSRADPIWPDSTFKTHLFYVLHSIFSYTVHAIDVLLVHSVADPGCLSRIPDPTFFHPGSELSPSRIPDPHTVRIKEFKYFNPLKNKKMVS
jgi:hypothetical protein